MKCPRYPSWQGTVAATLVAVAAGWAAPAHAQTTPSPDNAKLLEQLKSLEDTVTKARTGNNVSALSAIIEAAGADNKAVAFWLDSVREVEYRDRDRKESEFRAWRDGPGRRYSEPGAAGAIRLHLRYLALTIRMSNATTDAERGEILTALYAYVDDFARADKDTLRNRQALDTPVLGTAIAKRYKLDITVRAPEEWSLLPGNLEAIYENSILPYLREKKDAARLQTAWTRRIQQEAALVATQNSEQATKDFREVVLPRLEWAQARDVYLAGSAPAANKLLQIIQQNQGHKSVPHWIRELRSLLTEGAALPEPARAPGATETGTTPPEAPDSEPPARDPDSASTSTPGPERTRPAAEGGRPRPGGPPNNFRPNRNR